jgi:hypothetical protein
MGRRLLLLLFLLPVLAACALPGTDAAKTQDCQEGFAKGLLDVPGNPDFDGEELRGRIHAACAALVQAGLDDDSSDAEFVAALKNDPDLTGEICGISTQALYEGGFKAVVQAFDSYITLDEAMRLGRDGCVYAVTEGYGSIVTGLNAPALFKAHPYLVAPFCRAPLMQAYDAQPPPQPRKVYEAVVTQVCLEGIRTGVIDYSSGDFLNPSIDEKRFRALLDAEWARR